MTYGTIFYSKVFEKTGAKSDISLTSGLISAIYSMTAETEGEKIENLDLEEVRTLFQEEQGEKLFILTLDKRMDTQDAKDMLDDIIDRFKNKYGDKEIDGAVFNDFETEVDEVVAERLWYNNVSPQPKVLDIFPFLALMFSAFFYPQQLIDGQNRIIGPITSAFASSGIFGLLLQSFIIGLKLVLPIVVDYYLLKKLPNMKGVLRYTLEYLHRPTRGSYAEILPWWFLAIPVLTATMLISSVRYSRGIYYSLFSQTIGYNVESITTFANSGKTALWYGMYIFIALFLLTWLVLFPLIVGFISGNFNWQFMKSMGTVMGISLLFFVPANIFSGIIYQTLLGFHPEDISIYPQELITLNYIILVMIPTFLCLLAFAYYMGIGGNQLIKENRSRYPVALTVGILTILALQKILFWYVFNSTSIYPRTVFA